MVESYKPTLSCDAGVASLLQERSSAAVRFSEEFCHSLVYSAIQSPINGVVQLVDKVRGTNVLPRVQMLSAPSEAASGTAEWHGQVLGGAAGVAIDFMVLRRLCGSPSMELSTSSMVKKSALTGALLNGVFRPTDPEQDFLTSRVRATAIGAASFAALTALEGPVSRTLKSVGINSGFLTGALSGLPVGAGEALLNNVTGGKHQSIGEAAYASMLTGGILGQFHAFGRAVKEYELNRSTTSNLSIGTAKAGTEQPVVQVHADNAPKAEHAGNVAIARPIRPGDSTAILEIAQVFKLPPRTSEVTIVLEVNGKVRGYANLNDTHRTVGEMAVVSEYRGHSLQLMGAVRDHIASMGGVWTAMARVSTSGRLLDSLAKRGSITIIEKSEPYRGPTEPMLDFSFVVKPPTKPLSGMPLRRFLGIDETAPIAVDRSSTNLSESAHEQSNQWISSQMVFGSMTRGLRIAPAFGEPISSNGKQRGARYALISVDETHDPVLKTILQDAQARFGGLSGNKELQALEIARYVRRICNPNNEGVAIERRSEAVLAANAGGTIPLGEFIRTNNCLCVHSAALYKRVADGHRLQTTLKSAQFDFGQHAYPESFVNKNWLLYDSARAIYGVKLEQPGRRR